MEVEANSSSIICKFLNQRDNSKAYNITYTYESYLRRPISIINQTSEDQIIIELESQNEAEDYNFHVNARNIDLAMIVNVKGTYSLTGKYCMDYSVC